MEEQNELQTKSFVPEETPEEDNPKKKLSKKQLILLLSCCFVFIIGVTLGAILIATPDINGTAYLTYSFDDTTKTATITGYTGNHTDLTIPDTIEGYIVTKIGNSAFYNCDNLTSVTIPDSVTEIDSDAFSNCSSLTSVTIPDSVTWIGSYAFYNCTSLTSVYYKGTEAQWNKISIRFDNAALTKATRYYYSETQPTVEGNFWHYVNGVPTVWPVYVAPSYSEGLAYTLSYDETYYIVSRIGNCTDTDVVIPSEYNGLPVKEIGAWAFYNCDNLTSITIGNSVTSIGEDAFHNCFSLASITIPDSVISIASFSFWGCTSLTSVTIPDSVTSIGEDAFHNCSSLTSITIPDSLISIGSYAFSYCSNLVSITIPNSVTSIGEDVFAYCTSLTSIQYRGTEEQWSAISKGSDWDYDTSNYTITYNYTDEEV